MDGRKLWFIDNLFLAMFAVTVMFSCAGLAIAINKTEASVVYVEPENLRFAVEPGGLIELCAADPTVCAATPGPARIVASKANIDLISKIDRDVMREIHYITDEEQWGVNERWSYPVTGLGDCEDFALEKRRRLIDQGFPANAIAFTFVFIESQITESRSGHLLLTLDMISPDGHPFELYLDINDNWQGGRLFSRSDLGDEISRYDFWKRQSRNDPSLWVIYDDYIDRS